MQKNELHVWTCDNNKDYYPSRGVVKEIPSGFYMSKYAPEYGSYLSKIEDNQDESLNIITRTFNVVKKDFDKFWSLEKKYKSSGIEFKRAALLHGHPGNGKKYIAKRIGKYFVEKHNGIVVYTEDPEDAKKAIGNIRTVEGDSRKILLIMKDIGIMLEKFGISSVTSFLKDITNDNGVYLIGTTNHEDRVADYVSDKPRMFDIKFEVDYPTDSERKKYIKFLSDKFEIEDIDVTTIVKDTDGLSLGYIRNLIESHFVYGYKYDKVLDDIKQMKENIVSSFYSDKNMQGIGFN